jgi:hypothetical protein
MLLCVATLASTARADERGASLMTADRQFWLAKLNISPLIDDDQLLFIEPAMRSPGFAEATNETDSNLELAEPAVVPLPPAVFSASSTLLAAAVFSALKRRPWRG